MKEESSPTVTTMISVPELAEPSNANLNRAIIKTSAAMVLAYARIATPGSGRDLVPSQAGVARL
jgi:hypothetical protein